MNPVIQRTKRTSSRWTSGQRLNFPSPLGPHSCSRVPGWSMGGYGDVRFAQTFPGEVGAVATTIALVVFPNAKLPKEQNYPVSPVFGTDERAWPQFNCMSQIETLGGKRLLIITGKDAFDAQMNRNFHAALDAAGIAHAFREVEGAHDFPTAQATLPAMLQFLAEHLK